MKVSYKIDKPTPKIPALLYAIAQPGRLFTKFWLRLASLESAIVRPALNRHPVDRPIYITGLARAGTTITLEMLFHHPEVASHRYLDMMQPYLPFLWNRLVDALPLPQEKPQERPHRDGIWYTKKSPEAVEEFFWLKFFKDIHDENQSNVLDGTRRNRRFDKWYTDQIAKLVLARKKQRYLSKANYNVTRIKYLTELFPDVRFLVLIRDPLHHMISYLKQQDLLTQLYDGDRRWWVISLEIGHYEFGRELKFINSGFGDTRLIRQLWNAGDRVRAFAHYWCSIYDYLHGLMERDPAVKRAVKVVRFEDLCNSPGATIDEILDHVELDAATFKSTREEFTKRLHAPDYYQTELSPEERDITRSITAATAERWGYSQ